MPAATYDSIASYTVSGTSTTSYSFTSIPSTYTDLVLICVDGNTNATRADIGLRFNGDSGTNYSRTYLLGNGTQALSSRWTNENALQVLGYPASGEVNTTITHIMNYSNTTTNKTILTRLNNIGYEVVGSVGLWRSTSAINSVEIRITANAFSNGSTFNLYGIRSAQET